MTIDNFWDPGNNHRFLSNFSGHAVVWRDEVWPTSEHAYQAAKCVEEMDRLSILHAETPGRAKRLGRRVKIRPDWDEIKDGIMDEVLAAKFARPHMQSLLLSTGDEELIEGNLHHDNYWGDCRCGNKDGSHPECLTTGQNKLGIALMVLRGELRARLERSQQAADVQHSATQHGEEGLSSS